jgi:hypothetical protein
MNFVDVIGVGMGGLLVVALKVAVKSAIFFSPLLLQGLGYFDDKSEYFYV